MKGADASVTHRYRAISCNIRNLRQRNGNRRLRRIRGVLQPGQRISQKSIAVQHMGCIAMQLGCRQFKGSARAQGLALDRVDDIHALPVRAERGFSTLSAI